MNVMLSKQFVAKTKSGIELILEAQNTEKALVTNYKVANVPTKQGAVYALELTSQQAKELLTADVPKAYVILADQRGWKAFKNECLRERYEAEQARPKSLKEQREALRNAEYNSYSDNHFPGSKGWQKWQEALKALNDFDVVHPEIKTEIEAKQEQEREESLKHINIWNL